MATILGIDIGKRSVRGALIRTSLRNLEIERYLEVPISSLEPNAARAALVSSALRELIIARRLEAALSKARIFEIYLNVIEWGDGVWGAEAASRLYFGIPASRLSREQAALLAGAIINPRALNVARPNRRLLARQRIILSRMGGVEPPTPVPTPAPDNDEEHAGDEEQAPPPDSTTSG